MSKMIYVKCHFCRGTGKDPCCRPGSRKCPICNGEGHEWISKERAEREILKEQVNKLRSKNY